MSNDLNEFKENMCKTIFGTTKEKAQGEGLCVNCNEPALPKCYSEAGIREFHISGLCEECYDKICE